MSEQHDYRPARIGHTLPNGVRLSTRRIDGELQIVGMDSERMAMAIRVPASMENDPLSIVHACQCVIDSISLAYEADG